MKPIILLFLALPFISSDEITSSRVTCDPGNNEYCETIDYEGACCANIIVLNVDKAGTGKNEVVG